MINEKHPGVVPHMFKTTQHCEESSSDGIFSTPVCSRSKFMRVKDRWEAELNMV